MGNTSFSNAKKSKFNEFYTKLSSVTKELNNYKKDFENKIVYCNADDPFESNFFKFFVLNFEYFKLKKLITTSYAGSSIVNKQLVFEDIVKPKNRRIEKSRVAYKVQIDSIKHLRNITLHSLEDAKSLIENNPEIISHLKGDDIYSAGDFRSKECIEILRSADIVVTNPPFSLLREYLSQLMKYKKKFLIMSNINAFVYKEQYDLLMKGKIWTGFTHGAMSFEIPIDAPIKPTLINKSGIKEKKLGNICWITNLHEPKEKDFLLLYKEYTSRKYPKYLGYNAINVNKLKEIPYKYDGEMGVPITIFLKLNPKQFEVIGLDKELERSCSMELIEIDEKGNPTGKMKGIEKARFFIEHTSDMKKPPKYKDPKTGKFYKCLYARIVIKARKEDKK